MTVNIDVISDVVCPWCYIGKRRLEQALRRLEPAEPVRVEWRPFQLNPWIPAEGMARQEYVRQKFGPAAKDVYARVARVGEEVGIRFAFDRIVRQPNTLAAHALIRLAGREGRQDAVAEALFAGYFLEGSDLTDAAALTELAARGGVPAELARQCLEDDDARAAVLEEERSMRELGVEGVPLFVFNRRFAVSGAQPAEVLLRAIERARHEPVSAGDD